ncbi:YceI family protein [Nocardia cyriacigeorgica]|uniref:YceI family protein n=2 Tax=Nocardia cyriacigeorgica TaxID=135487 RepID=A0ABX0CEY0_9NOCA|nr:YceI family protein [Nocardia cyriacigeorgica]NEW55099.1 YceI family protein [Nocardia cyriacigeorgica]
MERTTMDSTPATMSILGYPAGTWKADPGRSTITFSTRFLTVSVVRGRFTGFDATLITAADRGGPAATATIDTTSLDTGNDKRDHHLRSADYLDVERFPAITFRSTGARLADNGWVVDGELTLLGVTRPVPIDVELTESGPNPSGEQRAAFSATALIDRRDFGLHVPMDGGGAAVGRKVTISLYIDTVLQRDI